MTTDQVLKTIKAEKMLKAIIKAQVKGGCEKYKHSLSYETHLMGEGRNKNYMCDKVSAKAYILEILLDTDGLKAAYPGQMYEDCSSGEYVFGFCPKDERHPWSVPSYSNIAHSILTEWNTGNNAEAAIKTAYDLLP